ncbi:helix-turn-helix domain-containing protein [Emcibacter sp. SYSU 3D8]|uniref:helix-turn-helix transcriptional regulator n=1 Tax=Emcibacter sp. SYSU 3D8 TaxID=3133969 RepID=UPI0031FEB597
MKLIHVNAVCGRTGLGRTKVYELLNAGRIRSVKIGDRRLVEEGSVDEFIQSLLDEQNPGSKAA